MRKSAKQHSYSVRLAFENQIAGKQAGWEDRIVVFRASSEDEPLKKARAYGKNQSHSYKNFRNQTVRWKFKAVVDSTELLRNGGIQNGVEVWYAFTFRPLTWEQFQRKIRLASTAEIRNAKRNSKTR